MAASPGLRSVCVCVSPHTAGRSECGRSGNKSNPKECEGSGGGGSYKLFSVFLSFPPHHITSLSGSPHPKRPLPAWGPPTKTHTPLPSPRQLRAGRKDDGWRPTPGIIIIITTTTRMGRPLKPLQCEPFPTDGGGNGNRPFSPQQYTTPEASLPSLQSSSGPRIRLTRGVNPSPSLPPHLPGRRRLWVAAGCRRHLPRVAPLPNGSPLL